MRGRFWASSVSPRFCCSAVPRMRVNTVAERRAPVRSTSLTVTKPASATGISRRMASPISRFNNSRTRWSRMEGMAGSQFRRDFLGGAAFDRVADLEVAEAFDANAALQAGAHFVDFVLEAAQRLGDALEQEVLAAHDAHLAADDPAAADDAARHRRTFGELEDLAHLGRADDDFAAEGLQQAGHGLLHLVNQLVNDGVELDLHPLPLGLVRHAGVDARVETQNDRIGGGSQGDIRFGD